MFGLSMDCEIGPRWQIQENIMMPFGLTNVRVFFKHMMKDLFCEYFDDFVVCNIDFQRI
jgi:hypothetical protein